jgi:glycosyltransferase involved in cell wall biosynthesis
MAKRRFLVMARVGDKSLHAEWLQGAERTFDLYLSYYGATPGRYAVDADHWRERKGPKWPILQEHLVDDAALVSSYEAVWFPDDDLSVDAAGINRLFALFTEHSLSLAQPALTADSYYSHAFLLRDEACALRHANFIEVMAPLLSAPALRVLGPTFGQSASGWGLDHVWPSLLRAAEPHAKVAIIDATPVRHTRPVGGELYQNNPNLSGWADLDKVQELYPMLDVRTTPAEKFFVSESVPVSPGANRLDLCVCTHNPRPDILAKVVSSVVAQDAARGSFRFILVDNASTPPLTEEVLAPLRAAGIEARLLREDAPGLQRARLCAIRRTSAEWILWVDDDNELFPDFVRSGLEFMAARPDVGCFGGRLLLPESLKPASWVAPFLPYLGIRDYGDKPIIARLRAWGPAEPAGAGAWVRRPVIGEYLRLASCDGSFFRLGRTGSSDLASCDDSCMMQCADRVGLACAYVPTLRLWHHLSPHRFRFQYLMRLMRAYGRSHVLLASVMASGAGAGQERPNRKQLCRSIVNGFRTAFRQGIAFALGRVGYEKGAYEEKLRLHALPAVVRPSEPARLPKVTLVTACLNSAQTIERTLRSILAQDYPNLEYIVYDGGSTDGTLEILRRHEHMISRLVSESDTGVANAYNKGFAGATGDIYCWLNADDELAPGALHVVGRYFAENPAADVLTGGCRRIYADGSVEITKPQWWHLHQMPLRNGLEQPSTFWRASAHHLAGRLDESYALAFDWEWWNRLRRSGASFRSVEEVLSVYHFSDSNLTSRAGRKVVDEMYRVTREYGPRVRGVRIADVYRFIFEKFDIRGDLDGPARCLPLGRRLVLKPTMAILRFLFGSRRIKAYNWNWASKQIRGVVWYR